MCERGLVKAPLSASLRWKPMMRWTVSSRDGVYFFLGESLIKQGRKAEAAPYYARLLEEFQQSEYLDEAKRRMDEFKDAQATTSSSTPAPAASSPSENSQTDGSSPPPKAKQ